MYDMRRANEMSFDGKLLAQARSALMEKRRAHDNLLDLRVGRVYAREPRVRALDAEITETIADLVSTALSHGSESRIDDIRTRNIELQEQRRLALISAGFPDGYLDDEYMSPKCRDTGYDGTEVCRCLMELYMNEQRNSLSCLFKLGEETFDSFDLSLYDNAPAPDTGISHRRAMEGIFETCVDYAQKFGKQSTNLFFNGAPGLGKTFLSACIARVVSDSGHSVVYDTASSVFAKFEDAKFMRAEDPDEARMEVKRCLECDLLIIDDIGTEMTTAYTVSALYDIINTRLMTRKKTIASSNLTLGELRLRYTDQIMSRLEGEYQVLTFYGKDIRRKRANAL
jgi:DNA replication protein DnaC